MMLGSYNFEILADYFAFILQDEAAEWDDTLIAGSMHQIIEDLFAVTPGMIHIGTVRNMTVPVTVEIHENEPQLNNSFWEQINECSVEIPSGQIVVLGNEYFPNAPRIKVKPGTYQAKILYDSLNTLRENGLAGDDKYKIVLWLGKSIGPRVVKSRQIKLRRSKQNTK